MVRASLAANTLDDLIKLAKAQPGKLTYASSGTGGAIHLASELFKREAGIDLVHVPYRGGGPAVLGLLSGDVEQARDSITAEPQNASDLPQDQRIVELLKFAVSDLYSDLRGAIGVAVQG